MHRKRTIPLVLLVLSAVFLSVFPSPSMTVAKPAPPPIQGVMVSHPGATVRTDPSQPVLDRYGRSYIPDPRLPRDQFPKAPSAELVAQTMAAEASQAQLMGGGPLQSPTFFATDILLAALRSWLESVDVVDRGQLYPRVLGNTSFYFDEANDNRLFTWAPNGPESLTYTQTSSLPAPMEEGRTMELGDLNGDGHLDAVVTFGYNNPVAEHRIGIMWGPDFSTSTLVNNGGDNPFGVEFVVSGGKDIALVTNWNSTYVTVLSWDGTQVVQQSLTAPQAGFNRIVSGDVDNDGDTDVVVMWGQALVPFATMYYNNGNGTMTRGPDVPRYQNALPDAIGLGDLDNDGVPEIIGGQGGNAGLMIIYKRTGDGQYNPTTAFYGWGASIPNHLWVDDLNGDQIADILGLYSGGEVVTFPAYAPGVFGQFHVHDAAYYATWFDTDGARYVPFVKNRTGRKAIVMANYNYGLTLRAPTDTMPTATWIEPEQVVTTKVYSHPDQARIAFEGYGSSFEYSITRLSDGAEVWSGFYGQAEGVLSKRCFFGSHGADPCPNWPEVIREGGQHSYRLKVTAYNDAGDSFSTERTVVTQFDGSVLLPRAVTKTVTPEIVHPGDILAYTISLTNPYTVAMTGWVEDTLPAELELVDAGGATYNSQKHKLVWGDLAVPANSGLTLVFTMRVPEAYANAQLAALTDTNPNAAFMVVNSAYAYCPSDALGKVSYQCQGGPPASAMVTTPGVIAPRWIMSLPLVIN